MVPPDSTSTTLVCDQCGLPFGQTGKGRGGITQLQGNVALHFCCYGCSFTHSLTGERGEGSTASLFLIRLGFAAFLSMNIMILTWVIYAGKWAWLGVEPDVLPALNMLLFVLSTPIMILVGYPFFKNTLSELSRLHLSTDSLIALGSFAAYGFSTYEVFSGGTALYFDTGTMVIVLVTAGRYLEATAKVRASSALRSLLDVRPATVRILRGKKETHVPASSVAVGEISKVLPGERIPLDGVVVKGETSVNESFLTGESLPVEKAAGSKVFAATVNIDGVIHMRVTAIELNTLHAQFVRLMAEAQRTRSPIQQLVDRISSIFIPTVISIAAGTLAGWLFFAPPASAVMHALTVLVVSCPCALGIGAPLATTIAIARAAEEGILIRSAPVLERLSTIDAVAFDKTGTLTEGSFSVASVAAQRLPERELVSVAASLEADSEHLIGKAIVSYAERENIGLHKARAVRRFPGRGIRGEVFIRGRWRDVAVGSKKMIAELGAANDLPDSLAGDAGTVFVTVAGRVKGSIRMSDTLRPGAISTARVLLDDGLYLGVLSGDSQEVVDVIGSQLSVRDAVGGLLPEEKVEKIRSLRSQGKRVLMVGDGTNDAPALASADVGVALGSATDLTKENADITVIGTKLGKIVWLLRHGAKTYRIIQWNLFWAFVYNIAGIILAVFGFLEPILAAFAMIISSFLITVNSRRVG